MSDRLAYVLTLVAALGSGLMAGLFFAFSTSVMGALGRLQPPGGIAAMQAINDVIQNPVFFLAFFGTALLSIALLIAGLAGWAATGTGWLIAGSVLYLAGILGVTVIFNVPMNDALAGVDAASAEGAKLWSDYLVRWTAWNHVRTVAGLASLACFCLALR
ncbi:anthrone oxygenase family protein [Mesorhizobium xinjiangense]|uniref:anthrone oxygenase family protein n=1 Tax=Mesorhizobium xinjiangense TaxID=2678685 RepID=UPI0012ED9A7D|nr:anthrone oxygenase family protein [Mesorhizobium xinjiangense]